MPLRDLLKAFLPDPPGINGLLTELEAISHRRRVRRMLELGARPDSRPLLLDLAGRGAYERLLAIYSVFASRDGEVLAAAARHPSALVSRAVARIAPLLDDDRLIARLLRDSPIEQRRSFLVRLVRLGKRALVDAYLRELDEGAPTEAVRFLHLGTSEFVGSWLHDRSVYLDETAWTRLARYHAHVVQAWWNERLAQEPLDARTGGHIVAVVQELGSASPDTALDLLNAVTRAEALPPTRLPVAALLRRRPREAARCVLTWKEAPPLCFDSVAHRLEPEVRRTLVALGASRLPFRESWLRRIDRDERASLAEAFLDGHRNEDGLLPLDLVARFPQAIRHREARRHLGLAALTTRTEERLAWASLLPCSECQEVARATLGHPDPALRVAALTSIIESTRYERSSRDVALALVVARKNEQDPVRLAMLRALAALPQKSWRKSDLPSLETITEDALAASDASAATSSALMDLLWSLVATEHESFALARLAAAAERLGSMGAAPASVLNDVALVGRCDVAFAPLLKNWMKRREFTMARTLVSLYRRRLRHAPNAHAAAWDLAREQKASWDARSMWTLLARDGNPREFESQALRLIELDPSWGVVQEVLEFLSRYRQDRLLPFLGGRRLTGRFHDGKIRLIPHFEPVMLRRWTPALQAEWARRLEELLTKPHEGERELPTKLRAVRDLATLTFHRSEGLVRAADDADASVRECALRALGRLDDGSGVPILVRALGDERARIAIYALRRGVRAMKKESAIELLRDASLERVTVAKEVVRLVGDVGGEDARQWLLALDGALLHRDVEIARLRALWSFANEAAVWDVFDAAAARTDGGLLDGLLRLPSKRLNEVARHRFARLFLRLVLHPDATVAVRAVSRFLTEPLGREDEELASCLADLCASTLPDIRRAAASALVAAVDFLPPEVFVRSTRACRSDRRALRTLVEQLGSSVHSIALRRPAKHRWARAHEPMLWFHTHAATAARRAATRAILTELADDPRAVSLRVALAISNLPAEEVGALIMELVASEELHEEAFAHCLGFPRYRLEFDRRDAMLAIEAAWRANGDPRIRRLALEALVTCAGPPHGWDASSLATLEVYRRDPAPLVAEAAMDVVVAE